jgi:hypothetical protein
MTGEDVERSLFGWDRFRRRMLPFIAEYPLVLSPAAVKPAVRHVLSRAFTQLPRTRR